MWANLDIPIAEKPRGENLNLTYHKYENNAINWYKAKNLQEQNASRPVGL